MSNAVARTVESLDWLGRVTISDPDTSGRVILSTADGPVARFPVRIGAILRALQSNPHPEAIPGVAAAVGLPEAQVTALVERLATIPSIQKAAARPAVVQRPSPFTVQLTLCDPSRFLRRDGRLVSLLRHWSTWAGIALANVAALVLVVAQLATPGSALRTPMSMSAYGWLLLGCGLAFFVHEFSHAAALVAAGGRPRRLGVMLFYLAPAFFCDVRDAWSVSRGQRLLVALAGVASQGVLALVAGVVALAVGPQAGSPWAAFALVNMACWLFNLVPFVKLDGYVALAGGLDRPHLRDQALQACSERFRHALLGTGRPTTSAGLAAFGLACAAMPPLLLLGAAQLPAVVFAGVGHWGARLELAVLALLAVWFLWRGWGAAVREIRGGVAPSRVALVGIACLAAAGAAITWAPVPSAVAVGAFVDRGQVVVAVLGDHATIRLAGQSVSFHEPGLMAVGNLGRGVVVGDAEPCQAPLSALAAVRDEGRTVPATCFTVQAPPHVAAAIVGTSTRTATGTTASTADTGARTLARLWEEALS